MEKGWSPLREGGKRQLVMPGERRIFLEKSAIIVHYLALQCTADMDMMQITVLDVSMTRMFWADG